MADQGISSLGNFVLVVAVARVSDADAFGAFSLAYLAYGLCLALFRAGLGDVLLLRTRLRPEPDDGYRGFLAVALGLGLSLGVLLALPAAVFGDEVRDPMLAIAIALPLLLLQDAYRFVLISGRRSRQAVLIDAVWLLLQVGLFAGSAALSTMQSGPGLILLWTGAGLCSVLLAYAMTRLRPDSGQLTRWLGAGKARIRSLMMDYLVFSGTVYASLYAVPLIANLATLAALRGAQVLFAPFEVVMNGARLVTLPALANALSRSRSDFRRRVAVLGGGFFALAFVWGAIVISLPDSIGEAALGDTWAVTEPLLLAFAIGYIALSVSTPAMDGVRGGGSTRMILTTRVWAGILQGGGILVGVAIGGTEGGAVGFAAGLWLGFLVWIFAASKLEVVAESGPMNDAPEQVLWDPEAGPN
jgi:O-antigen/teichoic acid export membrane protein